MTAAGWDEGLGHRIPDPSSSPRSSVAVAVPPPHKGKIVFFHLR